MPKNMMVPRPQPEERIPLVNAAMKLDFDPRTSDTMYNYDFHTCSRNQAYIPQRPCVTGANDAGYLTTTQSDGRLPGVRVAFFPELGYLRGGYGHELRDRIVEAIRTQYWDTVQAWDRHGKNLPPRMTLNGFLTR